MQLQEALFFVDHDRLDFSAIEEDESEYADKNGDDILPPVTRMKKKWGETEKLAHDDIFEKSLGEDPWEVFMNLPFSIALEYRTMLTKCQMVDEVQSTDHDEGPCDPQCARVPTKYDLLVRL